MGRTKKRQNKQDGCIPIKNIFLAHVSYTCMSMLKKLHEEYKYEIHDGFYAKKNVHILEQSWKNRKCVAKGPRLIASRHIS